MFKFTCTHCGHEILPSEAVCCGDDILCDLCAVELTAVCDECGGRFYTGTDDDCSEDFHTLCRDCYERYYTRCDNCGILLRNSNAFYSPWNDQTLCVVCYDEENEEDPIHEYGYKPDPVFHGDGHRYFGVELEMDYGGTDEHHAACLLKIANKDAENLYIKTDSSLESGLELVTHPMSLEYHMSEMPWRAVLSEARSMRYSSHTAGTCGLHIHISREAFGITRREQDEAIARLIFFVEKFWPEMLRFSRRTQSQLDRWASRYGAKLNPTDQLEHAKKSGAGRYAAVNLQNHSTIELRLFRGTLKLNTVLATIQMADHLCDVAVSMCDKELQDLGWHEFLEDIHEPELIQYLKERRLYVNEPVNKEAEI